MQKIKYDTGTFTPFFKASVNLTQSISGFLPLTRGRAKPLPVSSQNHIKSYQIFVFIS